MAAEHWFRWHHGTVTDPKWRVVASRCVTVVTGVTVGHVLAVWAAMMENASLSPVRGTLSGWDDEDVAAGLGFTTEQVCAIREAMQGKTLDGESLAAWEKRQPKREDSSADRMREHRAKKRGAVTHGDAGVTQSDAAKRDVTLETETETEEKHSSASAGADAPERSDPIPYREIVAGYNRAMVDLAKVRDITAARKTAIRRVWQSSSRWQSLAAFDALWAEYADDDFHNGTGPYRNGHENWRPDFDYLIQLKVVTKIFERAMDRIEREARA